LNIDAPLLLQAARAAAAGQQYPAGALYVVATPIGNLADFSLRAIHVLALVDAVACEDTRVTAALLRHLGLAGKPMLALHDRSEAADTPRVLARLATGERVAYVSDAGTPAVSDPGARLVAAARAAGHRVLPVPGASAVASAISVAGDARAQGYRFDGFVPASGAAREAALQSAVQATGAVVLFEAPHRVRKLAAELAAAAPAREVTVARELTKQFESINTLAAAELPAWFDADPDRQRGEFVWVLHAAATDAQQPSADEPALDALLGTLMQQVPLSQAASLVAQACGRPRKAIYARALALQAARDAPGEPDASAAD
jgi:16S rRNA (cytidine1402-2'-O)-methyltransferase